MNRREFLEKFVALSSVSLILTGCVAQTKDISMNNNNPKEVKFKNIISDPRGDRPVPVYGPPPVAPQSNNNNGFQPIIQKR